MVPILNQNFKVVTLRKSEKFLNNCKIIESVNNSKHQLPESFGLRTILNQTHY